MFFHSDITLILLNNNIQTYTIDNQIRLSLSPDFQNNPVHLR